MKNGVIAVFDSGVGGISVLRHLRRLMPKENFLYFGDCANAPYGNRSTEEVRNLTLSIVEWLMREYSVKALVVACNTATSAAIADIRKAYPQKIIIGIEPARKPAADRFPCGHIGIMATEVTLREEKLQRLMERCGSTCQVSCIAAPGLVELVEQGKGNSEAAVALLTPVLQPYRGKLDALVLGCTHYPFAQAVIAGIVGEKTWLLDGGEGTARETRRRLQVCDLLTEQAADGTVTVLHSGENSSFEALARSLME